MDNVFIGYVDYNIINLLELDYFNILLIENKY